MPKPRKKKAPPASKSPAKTPSRTAPKSAPTPKRAAARRTAQASRKPQLARKLLAQAIEFYEMLFPAASGSRAVVDFGSDQILKAMFGIWNNCLRAKTVNPEFAFYTRAEMGLYNLLHMLRAKIDTSAALVKFYERIDGKGKPQRRSVPLRRAPSSVSIGNVNSMRFPDRLE